MSDLKALVAEGRRSLNDARTIDIRVARERWDRYCWENADALLSAAERALELEQKLLQQSAVLSAWVDGYEAVPEDLRPTIPAYTMPEPDIEAAARAYLPDVDAAMARAEKAEQKCAELAAALDKAVAALVERETRLQAAIAEARDHLGAALIQRLPSDDAIILGHVEAAHGLLQEVLHDPR